MNVNSSTLVLAGGVALLLVVLARSNRGTVLRKASGGKVVTPPVVPLPAPSTSPAPAAGTQPAVASVSKKVMLNRLEQALRAENKRNFFSPLETRALAVEMYGAALEEGYPLDFLLGHMYAEGNCQIHRTPNSARAIGPLQVTPIACQAVGLPYPRESVGDMLRVGIRYMRQVRRHSEASNSVKTALQIYGMGYGNWQRWKASGCAGGCSSPISVWRAECGCGRPYSDLVLQVARRHPELHSVPWERI